MVFTILIAIEPVNGQFYGGDHDGFTIAIKDPGSFADQMIYCGGGNADGAQALCTFYVTLNDQASYCLGGSYDGASSCFLSGNFYHPNVFFNGGAHDGWSSIYYDGVMFPKRYCYGGNGDGWDAALTGMSTINQQGFYCSAGEGDGFDHLIFAGNIQPLFYCLGGIGDGFQTDTSGLQMLGYGIWTGAASTLWTMETNWKNNLVPIISTNVLILPGAPFYPRLYNSLSIGSTLGIFQCNRLDILSGAEMTIRDQLLLNGVMVVSGTLYFEKTSDNNFSIISHGRLIIENAGEITIEE